MEDFKGNSHVSKNAPEQVKAITSNVTVKKQSEIGKFGKSIISEDIGNVGKKLTADVLVPGIKKLLNDIGTNFISWIIYGVKGAPSNKSSINGLTRISYSSMYDKPLNSTSIQKATLFTLDEIEFDDRGEAEVVLLKLKEYISRYGMVSAGVFYQMVQQPYTFTAEKYGWRDLSTATIGRKGEKYVISFPRMSPLE